MRKLNRVCVEINTTTIKSTSGGVVSIKYEVVDYRKTSYITRQNIYLHF